MNYLEYSHSIPLEQLAQNLDAALDSLPNPRLRDVLESIFIEGQTLRQVAERHHVTTSCIQFQRERALRLMRHPERLRILIGEDPPAITKVPRPYYNSTPLSPDKRDKLLAKLRAEGAAITKKSHDAHVRYKVNAEQRDKEIAIRWREQRRRAREERLRWQRMDNWKPNTGIDPAAQAALEGRTDPVPESSFRDLHGEPLFTAWWRLK